MGKNNNLKHLITKRAGSETPKCNRCSTIIGMGNNYYVEKSSRKSYCNSCKKYCDELYKRYKELKEIVEPMAKNVEFGEKIPYITASIKEMEEFERLEKELKNRCKPLLSPRKRFNLGED